MSPQAPPSAASPMSRTEFAWRAGFLVLIVAVAVLASLAVLKTATALLLLFTAGLLAVFLRGLAGVLNARTRLSPGAALVVVVLGLSAMVFAVGQLLAPAAITQASDLVHRLPAEVERLRGVVAGTTWGGDWLGVTKGGAPPDDAGSMLGQAGSEWALGFAGSLAGQAVSAILAVLLIVPAGLFFAAQPDVYLEGALRLLPARARAPAREISDEVVERLGWWLIGQAGLATVVSVATGLGLWALSVPLALILALLRGGLNVIPNVGPVVAIVPGLIIAAGQGGHAFVRVALMYGALQLLEGNLLTPLVNRRTVHMPPMLLVGAQLLLGVLFGLPGIIVAAPLTVVGMVLVQRLYVERFLGEGPGAAAARTLPEAPPEAARQPSNSEAKHPSNH